MTTFALLLVATSGVWLAAMAAGEMWARSRWDCNLSAFLDSLPQLDAGDSELFFTALSQRLTARFKHGWGRYPLATHPLFWIGGWLTRKLWLIENSDDLFRYSHRACCSQMAQALVDLATARGGQARVAALEGHVVAEGFIRGQWRVFDPDYGVIPRRDGRLLSLEELIDSPELAAAAYRGNRLSEDPRELLAVYRRGRVTRLPPGGHLSPRTAQWQRRLRRWRWAPPLILAASAAAMLLWD
jgi:hypothetical protein